MAGDLGTFRSGEVHDAAPPKDFVDTPPGGSIFGAVERAARALMLFLPRYGGYCLEQLLVGDA
jgi:hypothetical protein